MSAELRSPVVGTVLQILVSPGTAIQEGEEVVVIESMKMEIPVVAISGGTVREIHVRIGEHVEAGDLLLEID